MEKNVVYGFIGGLYAGRFTGFISNLIITGLTIAFYDPQIYSYSTVESLKNFLIQAIKK